ncbi:hypothetical protein VTP01DRAFT_10695 [Rhizomucor pusillus]|uniref:uncharacterized protein n=1 Tax=Rhizomucor pusillus TaxID=4840 RepID=UPI0037438CCA
MPSSALPNTPLFERAVKYAQSNPGTAIHDTRRGKDYTYSDLVRGAAALRNVILELRNTDDLKEERVAFLCPNGFAYVVSQWAIWAAGGIAVPLCPTHPLPEQLYTIQDSQASLLLSHPVFAERAEQLKENISCHIIDDETLESLVAKNMPTTFDFDLQRSAMILYTSGTTGKPKGAVTTHANIDAQTKALVDAWRWSSEDRIHHILPLHHVHGIINAMTCALYAGATVEMYQKFDPDQVWNRWLATAQSNLPLLTIFMSVPTVYSKLVARHKTLDDQSAYSEACKQFRFMVSGSASLPTPLRETWRQISCGQVLLERYGMTELGMALSQPYPENKRIEGTVGLPLEDVQTRIMAESQEGSGVFDKDVTEERNVPGLLEVKGPNVFKGYWQRPEATAKEFTKDGWFKTGDYAMRTGEQGYYQILGRASTDIIKTGGEKVSALEIERELLSSPNLGVEDVAVIGVDDSEWGQKVAAVVVLEKGKTLDVATMRNDLKSRIAVYKVPHLLQVVDALPKNAMGKVTKKELAKYFQN